MVRMYVRMYVCVFFFQRAIVFRWCYTWGYLRVVSSNIQNAIAMLQSPPPHLKNLNDCDHGRSPAQRAEASADLSLDQNS